MPTNYSDRLLRPRFPKSIRYTERLAEAGIEPSVGSKGDSYDNAMAESVIGLFKAEVIHRRGPWKGLDGVEFATLDWVAWFNNTRLLEPLGYTPPVEFEQAYYDRQAAHEPCLRMRVVKAETNLMETGHVHRHVRRASRWHARRLARCGGDLG